METYLDDRIIIYRNYFDLHTSQSYFEHLKKEIQWLQKSHNNEGRIVQLPRLTANYGERSYDYSGLVFTPQPWTEFLSKLKIVAEELSQHTFNALVLQYYRDGNDRVGWHTDDSPDVGRNPTIVSISFGETRGFWLRNHEDFEKRLKLNLNSGDILIMQGDLQHTHSHKVPKEKDKGARINLTFRNILD